MGKPEMPFTEWMGGSIERSSNWVNKHEFDSLIFLYLRGDQKGFSRTGGETARERLLLQQVSSMLNLLLKCRTGPPPRSCSVFFGPSMRGEASGPGGKKAKAVLDTGLGKRGGDWFATRCPAQIWRESVWSLVR